MGHIRTNNGIVNARHTFIGLNSLLTFQHRFLIQYMKGLRFWKSAPALSLPFLNQVGLDGFVYERKAGFLCWSEMRPVIQYVNGFDGDRGC